MDRLRYSGWVTALALMPMLAMAEENGSIVTLGTVRVSATEHDATTENTGSYRAASATIGGKEAVPVLEIPNSVSVITRQRIEDQNLVTAEDALREVVGVTVTPWDGQTFQIRSRGYFLEPTYDGIPAFGSLNATQQYDLAIYDRVEVLRGPGGLFVGSGQPGGTVNFVRKRGLAQFGGSGALSAGSWSNYRGELDIGGALNADASLRSRLVATIQDREFYYDHADSQKKLVYGTLDYDLGTHTEISVFAAYQDDETNPFSGLPAYTDGQFLNASRSTNPYPRWNIVKATTSTIAGELLHRFSDRWKLQARLSRKELERPLRDSFPATGVNRATGLADYRRRGWDAEDARNALDVYLAGSFDLWGQRQALTIGYNYEKFMEEAIYGLNELIPGIAIDNPDRVPRLDLPPLVRGSENGTRQSGYYGQLRLTLAEPVTVVLGARASDFRTRSRSVAPSALTPWTTHGSETGEVTPYGGIVYKVAENATLYGSYSDIFMPQTQRRVDGSTLDPRQGKQIEFGFKQSFNDDKLLLSAAVFRTRDVNRSFNDPYNPGFFLQAGEVEIKGWETEVSGSPWEGWDMSAGYSRLDSSYEKHQTLSGTPFSLFEPKHAIKLYAHYRFMDSPWSMGFGAQMNSGQVGTGIEGVREQGSYAVYSAQMGYQFDEDTRLTLTGQNIFDRHYYARVGGLNTYNVYGEPRNFMFSLRTRF